MNLKDLEKNRYSPWSFLLPEGQLVKVSGKDRSRYLSGQTTQKIDYNDKLEFKWNSKLDRTGKIQSYFITVIDAEYLFLFFPETQNVEEALEDIFKNAIMDDVEHEMINDNVWIYNRESSLNVENARKYNGSFFGQEVCLSIGDFPELNQLRLDQKSSAALDFLSGSLLKTPYHLGVLINNTNLFALAVNISKGCFLGQETVNKIDSRRGPALYPVLLETSSSNQEEIPLQIGKVRGTLSLGANEYWRVDCKRQFRVENFSVEISPDKTGKVKYLPYFKDQSNIELSKSSYLKGVESFHLDNFVEAEQYFLLSLEINSNYEDAYEALGSLYGRQERFEEAINLMNTLEKINQNSVMANTNKSLFLMRIGKIEEAEAEKSKATLKSFRFNGDLAKQKKMAAEDKRIKKEENIQRLGMFKQVLGIDADDDIANFGIGEISFENDDFNDAKKYLEKTIVVNPKYSKAYLILGQTYEKLKETDAAQRIYEQGIKIASELGDLMPANQMQEKLSIIKKIRN